jgi:hypothetical protein
MDFYLRLSRRYRLNKGALLRLTFRFDPRCKLAIRASIAEKVKGSGISSSVSKAGATQSRCRGYLNLPVRIRDAAMQILPV